MTELAKITLQLTSVAEILTDQAGDPDAPTPLLRSGLDELLISAYGTPADSALHIVLRLPREEINNDTAGAIRRALARQCAERIEDSEGALAAIREKTTNRLVKTLFIVAAALAAIFLLMFTISSLEFLRPALGGVVALGIWAIVASPIRTYRYQWQPHQRQIADCRRIMAATVDVEAA
jgi:hypothetical protein